MELAPPVDRALLVRRRALARSRARRRLVVLLSVIGLIVGIVGYQLIKASSVFAVRQVTVHGAGQTVAAEVRSDATTAVAGHSLLQVNTDAIEQTVAAIPYVREVRVDRAFPSTLAITVQMEHPAVLATVGGGPKLLIADDGRVLGPPGDRKTGPLPQIALPAQTALRVGSTTSNPNVTAALAVISGAPPWFASRVGPIKRVVASGGAVTAVVGNGLQLRLGSPNGIPLKMAVVAKVLNRMPSTDRRALAYIDVSAPRWVALGRAKSLGYRN
jgi:cell division protein FtsQ